MGRHGTGWDGTGTGMGMGNRQTEIPFFCRPRDLQSVMTMVEDAKMRCHSPDEAMFTVPLIVSFTSVWY